MTLQEFIKWLDKEITIPISSDSGAKAFAFVEAREKALTISPLMIQQWEYKIGGLMGRKFFFGLITILPSWADLQRKLNETGVEGWELIEVIVESKKVALIFKRPKTQI